MTARQAGQPWEKSGVCCLIDTCRESIKSKRTHMLHTDTPKSNIIYKGISRVLLSVPLSMQPRILLTLFATTSYRAVILTFLDYSKLHLFSGSALQPPIPISAGTVCILSSWMHVLALKIYSLFLTEASFQSYTGRSA